MDDETTTSKDLGAVEAEPQRRRRLLSEVVADFDARGVGLRMSENLPRDQLYDRPTI